MEQISNEALWGKLSEIDKKLGRKIDASQPSQLSIAPIIEKLEEVQLSLVKPTTHKHWHRIEIKSSKVFITLVSLSLLLLTAVILNIRQYKENNRLTDNDLKYRFIKAANQADTIKISELENIFDISRDNKVISTLRKRIENHERAVIKRAKALEQARWKEEEAKKLREEAELLKKGD